MHVFGCYVGDGSDRPKTLLYVGRANSHNGDYEIHGLQVDGSVTNLRLVEHGKYVFRVRIDGNAGFASQLASPCVLAREGATPYADVKIDCLGTQWPEVKK